MNFNAKITSCIILGAICVACIAPHLVPINKTRLNAINNGKLISVLNFSDNPNALAYLTGMTIDADGAPNAYGPGDCGIDELSNAGEPGHWSALATDSGQPNGNPIVKNGYYISTTSLQDESKKIDEPGRFVDATQIPFFVLPPLLEKEEDVRLGDFGMVINLDNGLSSPAIFADRGPGDKLGEGSVALARALGVDTNARIGGTNEGIIYIVFPHSGNQKMRSLAEIQENSVRLFQKAGGFERVRELYKKAK